MNRKTLLAAFVTSVALVGFAGNASAVTEWELSFPTMMQKMQMEMKKDGMISKADFLVMMGKTWDMAAQKMGAKSNGLNDAQMKEFLMYLRAGS